MTQSAGKLAAGMAAILCAGAAFAQSQASAATPSPASTTQSSASAPVKTVVDPQDIVSVLQDRYSTLYQKTSPAVVRVNAALPGATPDAPATAYVWSGFFVSKNGDILTTNAHYLQNAVQVWIQCGRVAYPAEIKGIDPVTDLAVIHATSLPKDFAVLDLADSTDIPAVGTMLLSVTCKEGELPGPSAGMLQGYNINVGNQQLSTLHLRTNIPDDGGEGGSPVLDLQGKLVGIMIASLKESRSSLVLPSRAALRVRDDLLTNGKVAYGKLGFDGEQKSDTVDGVRVLVTSVDYGGPALAAGLKAGDEITQLGPTAISSEDDMRQAAFYLRPGQDVTLGVRRGGQEMQLTLHVGDLQFAANPQPTKPVAQSNESPARASATITDLTSSVPDPNLPPPPVLKK